MEENKMLLGTINLLQRLRQGRQVQQIAHAEGELLKLGNLRAGNSGILTAEGHFAGSCPMTTHLRQLGISIEELTDDKLIMFQLGICSEDVIVNDLEKSLQINEVLLREEGVPISWKTSNGTLVTGRPDVVICDQVISLDGKLPNDCRPVEGDNRIGLRPKLGIEAKSIASMWTTCEILFEAQPKLNHLIQAAHYAWKLGTPGNPLPYKILYKQYANQVIPQWKLDQLPQLPPELDYCVEFQGQKVQKIKQVVPFEVVYDIRVDERGQVSYKLEALDKWTRSIVNVNDIERYYEFCSRIAETGNLGEKLHTIDVVGRLKQYSQCDRYCPAHMLFGKYAHDYQLWRDQVALYVESRNRTSVVDSSQNEMNTTKVLTPDDRQVLVTVGGSNE